MSLLRLILREISHRKLNFFLSVLGVTFAVAAFLGVISLLRAHDAESEKIISSMVQNTEARMKKLTDDTEKRMAKLTDDIRKSMKGLGFNIYVLPETQDIAAFNFHGYSTETMPEEYVSKLAESSIVTVNHLLPRLAQEIEWPERKRQIVLIGVRGEVPIAHRDPKKPLIDPVPEGQIVLGYDLHHSLDIKEGDSITLKGHQFTVSKTHAARSSKDDSTIWMNLGEYQKMFDLEGRISSILALECNCETIDRLGEIRAELTKILPGTQIVEKKAKALARAEARVKTAKAAEEEIARTAKAAEEEIATEKQNRADQRASRERFASTVAPSVTLFSMSWVALLAFGNVRERIPEIGVLRAVGTGTGKIIATFLGRAIIVGIVGALAALSLFWITIKVAPDTFGGLGFSDLVSSQELIVLAFAAPALAALAAWLPALKAALRDPASVLRYD